MIARMGRLTSSEENAVKLAKVVTGSLADLVGRPPGDSQHFVYIEDCKKLPIAVVVL